MYWTKQILRLQPVSESPEAEVGKLFSKKANSEYRFALQAMQALSTGVAVFQ